MAERNYPRGVREALFALCRGTCYWPRCPEAVLLIEDGFQIVRVDIAHICGLKPTSARHDPNLEDPDDFSNLLLLCEAHHKRIDFMEPEKYPVELLRRWKADREGEGVTALVGLRNLTEPRLQEIISESYAEITRRVDSALDRFAEIDSEAAKLLRMVRDELVNSPRGLDLDAVAMINEAGRDLQGLQDSASLLYDAADRLGQLNLGDAASQLGDAADDLAELPDCAQSLQQAANDLVNLPDHIENLRQVVEDWKRHRPEY